NEREDARSDESRHDQRQGDAVERLERTASVNDRGFLDFARHFTEKRAHQPYGHREVDGYVREDQRHPRVVESELAERHIPWADQRHHRNHVEDERPSEEGRAHPRRQNSRKDAAEAGDQRGGRRRAAAELSLMEERFEKMQGAGLGGRAGSGGGEKIDLVEDLEGEEGEEYEP